MRTIKIYWREISQRTGYRKYPFKSIHQVTVDYDGIGHQNHYESITNPKLKKPFQLVLETRSKKELDSFISKLGRCDWEKWLKSLIEEIVK